MVEKVGHRQDMNTGGILGPVHERAEVPRIAGEQVGCPASGRSLEDGPVLLRKARRKRVADRTFDEPDALGQRIQAVKELRKFPGQIPPRLLQGIGAVSKPHPREATAPEIVIPAKAGIQAGWSGETARGDPSRTPGFPLSRE